MCLILKTGFLSSLSGFALPFVQGFFVAKTYCVQNRLSMATAEITALKAVYQTKIDEMTDAFDKAKANVALVAWESAETTYQELLAASVTQYTAVGRTISKRAIAQAHQARDAARAELESYLGTGDGSTTYVDNGGRL